MGSMKPEFVRCCRFTLLLTLVAGTSVAAGGQVEATWTGAAGNNLYSDAANWSGGVVRARGGRRFYRVAASWTVPYVQRAADEDAGFFHDRPSFVGHNEEVIDPRCSIWVGLDGYTRWAASMPQLGTEHVVDGNGGRHRFWLQWWDPESTVFQYYLTNPEFVLRAGDRVVCHVEVLDDADADASVSGASAGDVVRFDFLRIAGDSSRYRTSMHMMSRTIRKSAGEGTPDYRLSVAGNSAQAVLERPASPYVDTVPGELVEKEVARSSGFHPMPDFNVLEFTAFGASARDPLDPGDVREFTVDEMHRISNYAERKVPTRTATVARVRKRVIEPRPEDGPETTLKVRYTG